MVSSYNAAVLKCICSECWVLTVDVDVGIGEAVAMLVADVALNHLSIFGRHIHKRQVIQLPANSPWIIVQLCAHTPPPACVGHMDYVT